MSGQGCKAEFCRVVRLEVAAKPQIKQGCRNAKGQRDRLLAAMTAATCCSGQQGLRLQSWAEETQTGGGGPAKVAAVGQTKQKCMCGLLGFFCLCLCIVCVRFSVSSGIPSLKGFSGQLRCPTYTVLLEAPQTNAKLHIHVCQRVYVRHS